MRAHTVGEVLGHPGIHGHSGSWIRKRFESALSHSGIVLDGPNPWDPQIHNQKMFWRIIARGTLGAGEAYVAGEWDCPRLDEMTGRLLNFRIDEKWDARSQISRHRMFSRVLNFQNKTRARHNVEAHYNLGNELYSAMLGPAMTYSCGYWKKAKTLQEAEDAKHDLICQKLGLQAGQKILDIGCGWGAFARYAAENYGVRVIGITLSAPQAEFAREHCKGLPVDIRIHDYRDLQETFDHVVSVGMFEHVGPANYRTYFESVRSHLAPGGLFLLHSIGGLRSVHSMDRWIARYIFPNAVLPSGTQIQQAIEGLFVLEDWHNFGADYDKTLMSWYANFVAAWPELRATYGDRFFRIWSYYLQVCAGSFRARRTQLWQLVLSPQGVQGGYSRPAA